MATQDVCLQFYCRCETIVTDVSIASFGIDALAAKADAQLDFASHVVLTSAEHFHKRIERFSIICFLSSTPA
jgi:hypothetical protein